MNQREFEKIANRYLYLSKKELAALSVDTTLPALDHMVISLLIATIQYGCQKRFEFLLARVIGKVPDVVENFNTDVVKVVDPEKVRQVLSELEEEI